MSATRRRGPSAAEVRRRQGLEDQIAALADSVEYVVAIDPASRVTGAAVLGVAGEKLVDAQRVYSSKEDPTSRMREIVTDLRGMIAGQPWPEGVVISTMGTGRLPTTVAIVIEIPTPKRSKRTEETTGGFGLPTYARAVGRIEALAEEIAADEARVVLVNERTWTGSRPKADNAAAVRAQFPQLDAARDQGCDVADAVGLGLWVVRRLAMYRRADP